MLFQSAKSTPDAKLHNPLAISPPSVRSTFPPLAGKDEATSAVGFSPQTASCASGLFIPRIQFWTARLEKIQQLDPPPCPSSAPRRTIMLISQPQPPNFSG